MISAACFATDRSMRPTSRARASSDWRCVGGRAGRVGGGHGTCTEWGHGGFVEWRARERTGASSGCGHVGWRAERAGGRGAMGAYVGVEAEGMRQGASWQGRAGWGGGGERAGRNPTSIWVSAKLQPSSN
jgi:hypothetical protein